MHKTEPEDQTMSENNNRRVAASDSAVDHAVEAGKRLRDAAGKVGGAYADACEQTILSISDFTDRAAGSTPVDWGKLLPGGDWRENAGAAIDADEVAQAGKQIGRAYLDAHERAALIAIEWRERLAAATNTDWVKSMASTQAALEREAVNTCFSIARGFLT
jgi:hypothetical protein